MKRLISIGMLIMIALLPLNSLAQQNYYSIQELQEQASECWTQTYQTKWRDITVDVQPVLPDAAQFPVLEVMIDFWQPDTTELGDGAIPYVADYGGFQVNQNEIRAAVSAITDGQTINPPYDMNHAYGKNSKLTLGDIMNILQTIWVKLGQDAEDFDYDHPLRFSSNSCYDENSGKYLFSDVSIVKIRQKLDGIPLLGHISKGIHKMKPQYDFAAGYFGNFNFVVSSSDLFYIVGSKMKIADTIAEDVPLCGFDKVKERLEKEITAGHIRKIFDVDLGYTLYNTPGMTNQSGFQKTAVFYAIPAWQVNCLYVDSGKKEMRDYSGLDVEERNTQESKTLFVNAQTGEIIPNLDNGKDGLGYQGYLSWEDAGGNH
ncbi:MAG: hypothetical protein RSI33_04520 [Clostridia bacterium]